MGLPRYLAAAGTIEDPEHLLKQADELIAGDRSGRVALLQCGRESPLATTVATLVNAQPGRRAVPVVVRSRPQAQSDALISKVERVDSVWIFADDLFDTFMNLFATHLAFELRARARAGMPVVGVGSGALALGGLLIASRVCTAAHYDLVGGLGWAPRVLVDGGADRDAWDGSIARASARSLPGLLAMDLGMRGAVRVEGGRVESIGDERIVLLGGDENARLRMLSLDPGQMAKIAPPPFAPFDRGLLPEDMAEHLSFDGTPTAPAPSVTKAPEPEAGAGAASSEEEHDHDAPEGRLCPMCGKIHSVDKRVELVA